ncbi:MULTISPECIES: nuclear transport factor 2 family protein [unclassified Pseudomonas]|uniref:nuclear transport factor 2 family protein n=1 Tax=unclassified Pseudomonas TaxID=196821 RepID=UPI0008834BCF|nr:MULTISPECIES: nuclear transport factor 2 family protein [unclassified Pseudomonas]SCY83791.1 SnoaL-like domain-containing protein [Pseudomonas sp. NFACC37-1]SFO81882.1 SnoaL-like domain-containing protein [Pseudomonas sp. NFACC24-1]
MSQAISLDERIAAEWACERLIKQFAQLNDAQDHDGIAELFVEDARFSRPLAPDVYFQGREAIRSMFRDRPTRLALHIMATILIEQTSASTARGRCYLIYVSNGDASSAHPAPLEGAPMYGQFDDEFVLTNDGWRFSHRRGSLVLKG